MYVLRKCVVNIYTYALLVRDHFNKRTIMLKTNCHFYFLKLYVYMK